MTREEQEEMKDIKQSDLAHRPYRFWDDMWNDKEYNYLKHAESD